MIAARHMIFGMRPEYSDSVFEMEIADYEISDGYCQLQLQVTLRDGFGEYTVDWGDGAVSTQSDYRAWHNYTSVGRYTVRINHAAKWWRLWECYTVDARRRPAYARPQIFPRCWSDYLESAQGTYCGWTDSQHGGVQGRIIPWGKSLKTVFCCWQHCFDVRGGFPEWTPGITDATGAFDKCTGLSGKIPKWGENITNVCQTFCDCPGVYGKFPEWPKKCVDFGSCYRNATGLYGPVPDWPEDASDLNSCFDGATGVTGIIPAWPENVISTRRCFYGCTGLTDAWTHDTALLMPEEKVRYSPDSDYYRCDETVAGCADAVRSLFWENWGGTLPHP